jgi:adenine/guanine phosphoribosyltransferase-like PRPP-binding protein
MTDDPPSTYPPRDQAWVVNRFGLRVTSDPTSSQPLAELIGVALRRNPRRAHLLVSTVLGKHIPTDPQVVRAAGLALGAQVAQRLHGVRPIVLGYAETATALGHLVAESLDARYLHSTRRAVPGVAPLAGFEESHSHATAHLLLPEDDTLLSDGAPLVLVDDELSTGRTARNTIRTLHALTPRTRYLLAALVDLRTATDRAAFDALAEQLGVRIEVVAMGTGSVQLPDGLSAAVAALPEPGAHRQPATAPIVRVDTTWPARDGGRHGFGPADVRAARRAARRVAAQLLSELGADSLVLGFEELMYAPLLIAVELAQLGARVRFSTTTRSPVLAIDEPGYPIRTALRFAAHDDPADGPGVRFAYNVAPASGAAPFSDVVLVVDDRADTAALHATDGLLAQLAGVCGRVHLVTLPSYRPAAPQPRYGPQFGSYPRADVAWLVTDLSHVELEAPTQEREEAIQSGGAHYAESLPIEYQPTEEYQQLFATALAANAPRVAHAVGVVTELVLAERGPGAVLVSLARAGTPIGVLMRRWAAGAHGLDLPHYTMSIVRGRGIDEAALRYLATHHDPADVVFVDGWTGKGAIARELAAAIDRYGGGFSSELAVLADPGGCVRTFGTRQDYLIPSACLNSTVSGLVSRTVLNDTLIGPGQFHGAKFYRELSADDVSTEFIDTIAARFADVRGAVAAEWPVVQRSDRTATWAGWAAVEAVSAEAGIHDVNLVKPGVGETTRVLLRRVPWRILVRPDALPDLAHVVLLARQRGVAVQEVPGLPYSCMGLIHPRYSRAGTGADARGVSG